MKCLELKAMKKIFTLGIIAAIFSIELNAATIVVTNNGFTFSPDSIMVNSGDIISFQINSIHNAVQVSKETWNANGNTPLAGGFEVPFGGGTVTLTTPGTYYYVCSPHASIGMKGVIVVMQTNSIKDIAINRIPDILVYPNPASEYLKIEFNAPKKERVTLDLIDIIGRNVDNLYSAQYQGTFSNTFSLPSLPNGKYFLRFNYGNETIVKPIVIKK
jgi:plastocyanin